MTSHYFPDADEPALQPFTQSFVRLMFAHAAFERRVSDLMGIITDVTGFGERPENQWKADARPRRMKKLINKYRPDGLPETDRIVACLKRSVPFCHTRNLLAHGSWWEFVADAITVRSGIARKGKDQHQVFAWADIQCAAMSLDELEVELSKLQSAIEARLPSDRPIAARGSVRAHWFRLTAVIRRQ